MYINWFAIWSLGGGMVSAYIAGTNPILGMILISVITLSSFFWIEIETIDFYNRWEKAKFEEKLTRNNEKSS